MKLVINFLYFFLLTQTVFATTVIKEPRANEDIKFVVSPGGVPTTAATISGTTGTLTTTKVSVPTGRTKEIGNADYIILNSDGYDTIEAYTTLTANRTITLPSVSVNVGRMLRFKKGDSSAFTFIVSGTVDGVASRALTKQYESFTIQSDGTQWLNVAENFAGVKTFIQSDFNGGPSGGFRNRIINGDMRIDQRNAGAALTLTAGVPYSVDRWSHTTAGLTGGRTVTVQRSTSTPPANFAYFLRATHTSTGTAPATSEVIDVQQILEGTSLDDFDWGKSTARNMVISFWVRVSTAAGTYGGAVGGSVTPRAYPFTFTVNASNTWEYKTVVVPGETATPSNWPITNVASASLRFNLCSGTTYTTTAGAWDTNDRYSATGSINMCATTGSTFDITGVQVETGGTQATPFEKRSFGTELLLAQRYAEKTYDLEIAPGSSNGTTLGQTFIAADTATAIGTGMFKVTKRVAPTVINFYTMTGTLGSCRNDSTGGVLALAQTETNTHAVTRLTGSLTAGHIYSCHFFVAAEL